MLCNNLKKKTDGGIEKRKEKKEEKMYDFTTRN